MKLTVLPLLTLSAALLSSPASAQTSAEPLDPAAAKAALTAPAKKPRFTPKSSVKSRTYTRTSKGAGVEIVEYANGQKEERPFVAVPILFKQSKADLLDASSGANVATMAQVLREILMEDKTARFMIQGHTSAEGEFDVNQKLSNDRASRIYQLLTATYGVSPASLSLTGFGEEFATAAADGPEPLRQQDRRVLVVKQ